MTTQLLHGDCRDLMRAMPANSVDAFVTDPPYGLSFMGKGWDHGVPSVEFWTEALRLAKPGAYLVAFGGTRTSHRLAVAIEDAGWEIRDSLMWLYGSGFPKSLDVSKAIDAAAGVAREIIGAKQCSSGTGKDFGKRVSDSGRSVSVDVTAPATDDAREWDGWGTALKPAWEPIILARKSFVSTVAANVLAHGTGALNIDACRIGSEQTTTQHTRKRDGTGAGWHPETTGQTSVNDGRWPANVVLSHSPDCNGQCARDCAVAMLDAQSGDSTSSGGRIGKKEASIVAGAPSGRYEAGDPGFGDTGGASRFFYTAKASRSEREAGLDGHVLAAGGSNAGGYTDDVANGLDRNRPVANNHPTVKPVSLMAWLVRLVTPPGGVVLDPFMGSGSTGCAARAQNFSFIGCELDANYIAIAEKRIAWWHANGLGDDDNAAIARALPDVPDPRPPAPRGLPSLFD